MNRQRLDSPLVYVGAHNVYYVKLPVKVLYFTIHIHTQINQYVVISDFPPVSVEFLGTTVTSNDDTLALQSSAAGSAQNVGIQILDRTGEVLVLDGATFSAKTDLIDGTNILPFQARYIALGQSVAGTANADATFKVQYL